MVNIRATFAEAVRRGVIAPELAARLTDIAKTLFYKKRTYDAVFEAAAASGLAAAASRDLADWLPSGRIEQKHRDAEAMLEAIRAHLAAAPPPLRVSYTLAETVAWEAAHRANGVE
jgi:hypothetical protein